MIPILYGQITEGLVPTDFGIGALTDCLTCQVTESRNGEYELTMEYPTNGIHAEEITPDKFIKAKPNFNDDPQIFQIYKVNKNMNGTMTVQAQHISYLLSGRVIADGAALSCSAACSLLQAKAGGFSIITDKVKEGIFRIDSPSSVRSWFGGNAGSLIAVFGSGEWHYDNFVCELLNHRGENRGVVIRYAKNLTDLSQDIDIQDLCTAIIPYYQDKNANLLVIGEKVSTGFISPINREIAVDFSSDCDYQSSTPIMQQLATLAEIYVQNNSALGRVASSITLDFVQLSSLEERVDLCDTVRIVYEALGISAEMKCISTTWDVLLGRYTSTTFGDPKTDITDTISDQQSQLFKAEDGLNNLNQAIIENGIQFYSFTNEEKIDFISDFEVLVAKVEFMAMQQTTVKILHEFIFDFIVDLAKDSSYEVHYYLDDSLIDYSPHERLGTITQLTEGDGTDATIARDFFYVLENVAPHIRHVWTVRVTIHNIEEGSIDVHNVHVTLEGQKLFADGTFDGFIEAADDVALYDFGYPEMLPIYEGTGADAPKVVFDIQNDYLLTESSDNLCTESGDRLIL